MYGICKCPYVKPFFNNGFFSIIAVNDTVFFVIILFTTKKEKCICFH